MMIYTYSVRTCTGLTELQYLSFFFFFLGIQFTNGVRSLYRHPLKPKDSKLFHYWNCDADHSVSSALPQIMPCMSLDIIAAIHLCVSVGMPVGRGACMPFDLSTKYTWYIMTCCYSHVPLGTPTLSNA